jgi:hypothetical protein
MISTSHVIDWNYTEKTFLKFINVLLFGTIYPENALAIMSLAVNFIMVIQGVA